jgi:hypothetical protein
MTKSDESLAPADSGLTHGDRVLEEIIRDQGYKNASIHRSARGIQERAPVSETKSSRVNRSHSRQSD